ncbi:MAG: AAA family ATPase, partial [Bryobacterales bacterium]|nr:AAA family ATPase [Bryobacterales bacterium]
MLIALGGLPGVGKSTLAASLARRIGAVHLRIDTIEQAMRNVGFEVSGPEGYLAARDLAEDNLRIGH